MRSVAWLFPLVALLALPVAGSAAAEESVEERLARLEKLVEAQQRQMEDQRQEIEKRDHRIQKLESDAQVQKHKELLGNIEARGAYFQADQPAVKADDGLRVLWKDGLLFQSADKKFEVKFGGRYMFDYVLRWEDENTSTRYGEQEDGFEHRRTRLYVAGKMYKHVVWKVQLDFAEGGDDQQEFKDVYVGLTDLPYIGNWIVGHFYEPFSMESLVSDNYEFFLEESPATLLFAPERNSGTMIFNHALEQRLTWALGVFKPGDPETPDDSDGFDHNTGPADGRANWAVTARVTGLPWYEKDGRRMIHLGLGVRYENDRDGSARLRSRTGTEHLGDRVIDTGTFGTESNWQLGAELGLNFESFSFTAEYYHQWFNRDNVDATVNDLNDFEDADFNGAYVEASYFLTGEHRAYDRKGGVWSRLRPKRNFLDGNGGLGAFQLMLRGHWLDLNDTDPNGALLPSGVTDSDIKGGTLYGFTAGLGWYLNPNTLFAINFDRSYWHRANTTNFNPNVLGAGSFGDPGVPITDHGTYDVLGMRFKINW